MRIGTLLKIQIEGDKAQLESELIGAERDRSLTIRIPPIYTTIDSSKLIYKGNSVFVRYQRWGSVLGFQSQIIDYDFGNKNFIKINYPEKIENYDLRRSKRIDCYLPVIVKTENSIMNGSIINISKEGCLIVIDSDEAGDDKNFIQINGKLVISFHLPKTGEGINVAVAQRNFSVSKQCIRIGAEYIDMDLKTEAELNKFLLQTSELI